MPRWVHTPNVKTCQQCGGNIVRGLVQNFSTKKYCGHECAHAAQRKNMDECFWAKVDKQGAGGCWNWTASLKPKGYGQFYWRGKMHRAHRLAWTLAGRALPAKGLELAHRCDNRICVNPEHLFVATHAENMADCKAKGRQSCGERSKRNKLTEAQVIEIRANPPKLGRGLREIDEYAAKYGVSKGTIYCSLTRRTWSHI